MPHLVRDDLGGKGDGVADHVQVLAQPGEQRWSRARPCQQPSIGRQRIERAEEAQPVNEIADEGIDGNHAFGLELAEGNMDRPLVRPCGSQAVIRQIDAFADTHAGVAEEQEDISAEIVAAEQLLLQELILLRGERPGQTLRCARDIFAAQQMSKFRKLARPCQFAEDGA